MISWALFSFLAQGLLIGVDEFACHHRRRLPRWELAGHPVDTFCLLLFFASLLAFSPAGTVARFVVLGFGALSCLIITKDEWVHQKLSSGFENWLHAMLFLVHPVVVGGFYFAWVEGSPFFGRVLGMTLLCCGGFFLYQCMRGVLLWKQT